LHLKLSTKLITAFLICGSIVLIVGAVGIYAVKVAREYTARAVQISSLNELLLKRKIDHLNWVRTVGEFQHDDKISQIKAQKDPRLCAFGEWFYSKGTNEAQAVDPEIVPLLTKLDEPHRRLHESAAELERMLQGGVETRAAAKDFYQEGTCQNLKVLMEPYGALEAKVDEIKKAHLEAQQILCKKLQVASIAASVAGVVLAVGFGFWLSTSITRRLRVLSQSLSESASETAAAAGQVAGASSSQAEGSSTQAASLEEASASLEQVAGMIKQNSSNAEKANALARNARAGADTGSADMHRMSEAMKEIQSSSTDIGKIVKTIEEIAFQTNLLALNAAVEAARAGEAGMGFAVVADEVRKLAQRSAQASKETAEKIESAIAKTEQGVLLNETVSVQIHGIVSAIRDLDMIAANVAKASHEQSQAIDQVNTSFREIDKITQSNAAGAEESASAAEELSAHAAHLHDAAAALFKMVEGAEAETRQASITHRRMPAPRSLAKARNGDSSAVLATVRM
jgi:hypothetical protein